MPLFHHARDVTSIKNVFTKYSAKGMMKVFESKAFSQLFFHFFKFGYESKKVAFEGCSRNDDYELAMEDLKKNFSIFSN